MQRFFENPKFDFEVRCLLGYVHGGGADVGEILAAAATIRDGDQASWVEGWRAAGARLAAVAAGCDARGHRVSARAAYLRAATYHAAALVCVDGTPGPDAAALTIFREHRRCFDAYLARLERPPERVAIPYEGDSLPGLFFAPPGAGRGAPDATLILANGSDGAVTALWPGLGGEALSRGYGVLLFEGPGQQSLLFERGIPFRHDWEKVITPVVDFLRARPDVDGRRLALYGISQAGYWVPRALAFEHRLAGAIADPGVVDVATAWLGQLPAELRQLLERGDRETFNAAMAPANLPPRLAQELAWRSKPYGQPTLFDTFRAAQQYRLGDLVRAIQTPLLVTDPEGEAFWPGQARQLYDALPGPKTLAPFTAAEGAAGHCEPMARALAAQRMLDWLDETLAR